jgi:(2Fe-2S) ferredoxin
MARFQHLLLVCSNVRPENDPRGSCTGRGSAAVLERLKGLVQEHGLKGKVRAVSCGCLDLCAGGPNVVVFSADPALGETWYSKVSAADAEELFREHVQHGKRLARLVNAVLTR